MIIIFISIFQRFIINSNKLHFMTDLFSSSKSKHLGSSRATMHPLTVNLEKDTYRWPHVGTEPYSLLPHVSVRPLGLNEGQDRDKDKDIMQDRLVENTNIKK